MRSYHFDFERALADNGFYNRQSFFDFSDIEIRLLFLASEFVKVDRPFYDISHRIFRYYDKILSLAIVNLEKGVNRYRDRKPYFKEFVFRDYIDLAVFNSSVSVFSSFVRRNKYRSFDNGRIIDSENNIVLDVFETWQILTGVWLPFTHEGEEFVNTFDGRISNHPA